MTQSAKNHPSNLFVLALGSCPQMPAVAQLTRRGVRMFDDGPDTAAPLVAHLERLERDLVRRGECTALVIVDRNGKVSGSYGTASRRAAMMRQMLRDQPVWSYQEAKKALL